MVTPLLLLSSESSVSVNEKPDTLGEERAVLKNIAKVRGKHFR